MAANGTEEGGAGSSRINTFAPTIEIAVLVHLR